ncbi:MAG: hypothetical protein Kow0010_10660 [Dehalococcoidia bacterium]
MTFGMLHLFENPVGKTEHQIAKEQLDIMQAAEHLGFDSIWPAEHHFTRSSSWRSSRMGRWRPRTSSERRWKKGTRGAGRGGGSGVCPPS